MLGGIGIAQGLIDTSRLARLVREPFRFTIRQALRQQRLGRYRLRDSGQLVYLRHNTPDMNALDEIFRHGHYDLPHPVVSTLLGPSEPLEIVDLGANVGLFGAFALARFPNARVLGFEPDEANAEVHERTIRESGFRDRWELVRAAAATRDGTVTFSDDGFTTGHLGAGERVVPAVDVFRYLDSVDLLKIDVEGAEWELLGDPRFGKIAARAVALEYHPRFCPSGDPRAVAHEILRHAGYQTTDHPLVGPPGQGMVWAWTSR
jgi:FkbM family methyltransferase